MAKPPKDKIPKSPKNKPDLSGEDQALWAYVLRDVLPLAGRKPALPPKEGIKTHAPDADAGVGTGLSLSVSSDPAVESSVEKTRDLNPGSGLDRRNATRLRRGQKTVEGTLDLHGLHQAEAQTRLTQFLLQAHRSGKRCVLVITGKGNARLYTPARDDDRPGWMRAEPGVLRKNLPLWVRQDPLRAIVLDLSPARPRDGGTGAFYILLRRDRDR